MTERACGVAVVEEVVVGDTLWRWVGNMFVVEGKSILLDQRCLDILVGFGGGNIAVDLENVVEPGNNHIAAEDEEGCSRVILVEMVVR
jgi:hypothetical protein